jgi:Tfp pilus assembly protein PilN
MTYPWNEIWPVPEVPSDFALNVLVASAKEPTRKPRRLVWLLAALVPCMAIVIGLVYLQGHEAEAAKRAAILETQRKETEERLQSLQREFELASRREQELVASLANAKDEATRSKLQTELEGQKRSIAAAGRAIRSGSGVKGAKNSCSPGDPLCE